MKFNTIKWKIFKYNLFTIVILIVITMVIFNGAVRLYIESEMSEQLTTIAKHGENAALKRGPEFLPGSQKPPGMPAQDPPPGEDALIRFYFMLDRALREPLSVLNADYILIYDTGKALDAPALSFSPSEIEATTAFKSSLANALGDLSAIKDESILRISVEGKNYIVTVNAIKGENTLGLGWILVYSSLEKINQLQQVINLILLLILLFSSLILAVFSSVSAKHISAPLSTMNEHLKELADRNFGKKLQLPVDDELQALVKNMNHLAEKLEVYDKAQKTFLQNASHEFRTPLMSIMSYAEGIQLDVIDTASGTEIILEESRRLTRMVEDLLYLSRLDAIEESYSSALIRVSTFLQSAVERMSPMANRENKELYICPSIVDSPLKDLYLFGDEDRLFRAFMNILSNGIQHGAHRVEIKVEHTDSPSGSTILFRFLDDGDGILPGDLPYIFDRFYKGANGNYGLGLSIAKTIIEKHKGTLTAENSNKGAQFIIQLPEAVHTAPETSIHPNVSR